MILADFSQECHRALESKGLSQNKKYLQRLRHELEVLGNQSEDYKDNVFDYFMDMREKSKQTPSGKLPNSNKMLVSYLLDISDEDPVVSGAELAKTKSAEYPDIDTDFEDAKRELVKEYLIQKYGQENVASICALHQMHGKSVVKDISRIKNISYEEVDIVTKSMKDEDSIQKAYDEIEIVKSFFDRHSHLNLLELCLKLEGNVRHVSMHAAGVVISPQGIPLNELVGLEKAKDVIITSWQEGDARELSKVGLIKFDILGLNTLTVIKDTLKSIKRNHNKDIEIDELELTDKKILDNFKEANTIGVFQFEKEWIRSLLKKIKISSFDDISAVNALNRPGPLESGMDKKFWKIKNGYEQPSYLHPLLEPILKETYCIILYQEQVMEVARKLAGFSMDEADNFRSVLSKGKADLAKGINPFEKYEKKFIQACIGNNVTGKVKVNRTIRSEKEIPITATNIQDIKTSTGADGSNIREITCDIEIADELFSQIKTFAGYGFNKSHSVEYGFIAYQCMFLKTYYPNEFMASLLTNTPNKLDQKDRTNKFVEYFVESKRMKIPILKPDINKSLSEFYANEDGIQAGFGYIKSLGEGAVREVVSKRPYKSFKDFMMKVNGKAINKSAMLALIHSGAFDNFLEIKTREDLVNRYSLVLEYLKYKKDKKMEDMPTVPSAILAIGAEAEVAGGEIFNSILHLVDINKANEKYAADDKIMKFSSLDKMAENSSIRIMGYVESFSTFITKTGKEIGILNIKSGINSVKVMLWSKEVNEYRYLDESLKILRQGCVVAIRVKRSKDYNGSKTFVLDPKKMDKLI